MKLLSSRKHAKTFNYLGRNKGYSQRRLKGRFAKDRSRTGLPILVIIKQFATAELNSIDLADIETQSSRERQL